MKTKAMLDRCYIHDLKTISILVKLLNNQQRRLAVEMWPSVG